MAALDNLEDVVFRKGDYPVQPQYSLNWARGIVGRCKVRRIIPPLSVRRFLDRTLELKEDHGGARNKIARDFYGKDYDELSKGQSDHVDELHYRVSRESFRAQSYLKVGLSFAEARRIRNEAVIDERNPKYPQEIQTALGDFRKGLEKDMDESAKAHGFHREYSEALKAWNVEGARR